MFILRFIGRILSIGLILFIVFIVGGKHAGAADFGLSPRDAALGWSSSRRPRGAAEELMPGGSADPGARPGTCSSFLFLLDGSQIWPGKTPRLRNTETEQAGPVAWETGRERPGTPGIRGT